MLLPGGKILHKDLSTYYARSQKLINDLQEMRFSGYLRVSFWEYEGSMIFDTGKIIQIFVQDRNHFIVGHDALQSILHHLGEKEGLIDVYFLESEILTVLSSLNSRKMIREIHNINKEVLEELVNEVKKNGELGFIEIELGKSQGGCTIYFSQGSTIATVLQGEDGRIITETKPGQVYKRVFNLVDKTDNYIKIFNCDPIAAYEESVDIQRWVDFYELKNLLDKLHRHIFCLLKYYCSEKLINKLLVHSLDYIPQKYGFSGLKYHEGKFTHFNNNNLEGMKKLYLDLIRDIIEKIGDTYSIDRAGLSIGILPFLDNNKKVLQQYGMVKELEYIFNETK
jgi:Mor family transcriptional regulator